MGCRFMTTPRDPQGSDLPTYGHDEAAPGAHEANPYSSPASEPAAGQDSAAAGGHYVDHVNGPAAGEPPYVGTAQEPSKLALWTLILGAVSLVGLVVPLVQLIAWILAPVAIIMGIVALVKNRKRPSETRRTWMSILGIVLGVVSLGLLVFGALALIALSQDPEVQQCMNQDGQEAIKQCLQDVKGK
mgnify:CR=1 FL=1